LSDTTVRAFALRLAPGDDLRAHLEAVTAARGLRAGCVLAAVGSLGKAFIRLADEPTPSEFEGPFEIVALSGTLSPNGPHLHIAVADSNGIVIGGHLGLGSIVHTTVELVIGELHGLSFSREADLRTGYRELVIRENA
jgi:predicted DNA-binding protein with PD1-like motif